LGERTQIHQEYDASERQITELYVKAADQLGSDRAPVRLAGMHALERLANTHPAHRQAIVDVICAYLRMPMPAGGGSPPAGQELPASSRRPPAPDPPEERQVRLVAQRILERHLRRTHGDSSGSPQAGEVYWPGISLDLTGALLTAFTLAGALVDKVVFTEATFVGTASFDRATFAGEAWFNDVRFVGEVWFDGAAFARLAAFDDAVFEIAARFPDAALLDSLA
jgi:hypothetical protein